jgi:hypothetical protein
MVLRQFDSGKGLRWHYRRIARSMKNKIRVFWVSRYIFLDYWTNNIHLKIVLTGPPESSFRERGRKTHTTQFLGNFSMRQLKDFSAQTVFKIRDLTVLLDFEAAAGHLLLDLGLIAKSPHDQYIL